MLRIIFTFLVLAAIAFIEEIGWKKKFLQDEYQRKFLHISLGVFMASWPWFLSWTQIKALALIGALMALTYQRISILKGAKAIRRNGYGHITHPLSVLITAMLTQQRIFFCLAILHMALADGLAAVIGTTYSAKWRYKVFNQTKTVVGTMTFWLTSVFILGIGLLPVHNLISFGHYVLLVALLPPLLTLLENLGALGIDNLVIPPAVLLALYLAKDLA